MTQGKNIEKFYDNPLKHKGWEVEHDALEAEHFDKRAERFLVEVGEKGLIVDFDETMPPRATPGPRTKSGMCWVPW